MAPADDYAIRTEGLAKRYVSAGNELTIFSNLDFRVKAGERVAITGESGAGKSTLLYLLGGLDRPSEGKIYFGHTEITSLDERGLARFRNQEIGFVWQTHYLLPEFTALENVMMPLLIRGSDADSAAARSLETLTHVGLRNRATHQAGELSGGEQQRVVLARALAGSPKVLLADEPTGNLDFRTGDMIMDLFDELQRSFQLTSVLVTHNTCYAQRCDRILKLDRGILAATPELPPRPAGGEAGASASTDTGRPDPNGIGRRS